MRVRVYVGGGAQQVRDGHGRDGHFLADWHLRPSRLERTKFGYPIRISEGLFNQDDAIRFGNPAASPFRSVVFPVPVPPK